MNDRKPTLEEVYLEHYGVKGMRWGQRRTPKQLDLARAERKTTKKPVPTEAEKLARQEARKKKFEQHKETGKRHAKKAAGFLADLAVTAVKEELKAAMREEVRRAMRETMNVGVNRK